jgi:hypothetical protein
MKDRKRKLQDLAAEIRRSNDSKSLAIKEVLGLLVEAAKDSLVSSTGPETIRLQGEAQAFTRLLMMVSKEPPSIAPKGE